MENNREQNPVIVGLDIGTTKICAIVGQRTQRGKIEILGIGKAVSDGVARGVVTNIQKTIHGVETAVRIAADQANVDIQTVTVGIAGQHIKSMQHRGMLVRHEADEEVSMKDIQELTANMSRLMMPPGEEIIHVLPQEYSIDDMNGIKDPIGHTGVKLEANFHIISGQVTAIKNIVRCVAHSNSLWEGTAVKLQIHDLVLEPLASAEAVLSEEEKEAGVCLVDIGGGTTDIAIFYDGIIRHSAVIPFGGNTVTEDVKEGCGILKQYAEKLKVQFGSALASCNKDNEIVSIPGVRGQQPKEVSLKRLADVIQARMEEIIDMVYMHIQNSGYSSKLLAGIVITGGGSQLKHLVQLFENRTGITCRIGYPNEHIVKHDQMTKNMYEELRSPMYATGIGLLIKGIQKAENSFFEIQEEEKEVFELQTEPVTVSDETILAQHDSLNTTTSVIQQSSSSTKKKLGLFERVKQDFKKFLVDDNIPDISDKEFLS